MPTQWGKVVQVYGNQMPDTIVVAGGTGDFTAIAPVAGRKLAVQSIHVTNEGTGFKSFAIKDGGSGGTIITRIGVAPDVGGVTVNFDPPVIMSGVFMDGFTGTESCFVSITAKRIIEGK